jgi:hypothetical protein
MTTWCVRDCRMPCGYRSKRALVVLSERGLTIVYRDYGMSRHQDSDLTGCRGRGQGCWLWGIQLVQNLTRQVGGTTAALADSDAGGKTISVWLPLPGWPRHTAPKQSDRVPKKTFPVRITARVAPLITTRYRSSRTR